MINLALNHVAEFASIRWSLLEFARYPHLPQVRQTMGLIPIGLASLFNTAS